MALTSAAVPEAVRQTPVRFAYDERSGLWLHTSAALSSAAQAELRKLGVVFPRRAKVEPTEEAASWLQALPVERADGLVQIGPKTPVLFEFAAEGQLAEVAVEMLRLGNDRQGYCCADAGPQTRAWLRVLGPPYYTLLRAIDREGAPGAPIAYREAAPRVWVQLGYDYALADRLRPPPGQWLLLRPPHLWLTLPEPKLRELYDVLDFTLPQQPASWQPGELSERIRVPLRLARSSGTEPAELWLLRGDAIHRLEELVYESDNELLNRLAFAVAARGDDRVVVLRARPSRQGPPVLALGATEFRSFQRLPNLFLPIGTRLHPPLRRDAVARLLAGDSERVTWLEPHDDQTFTPASLPDDAFRPLNQWVEYVLDHDHEALQAWVQAARFEFEPFACREEESAPKAPPKDPQSKRPHVKDDPQRVAGVPEPIREVPVEQPARPTADPFVETLPTAPPSELNLLKKELEQRFRDLGEAAPDDPRRAELWPRLAQVNGALGQLADATVCWANALWESERYSPDWPLEWYRRVAKKPRGAPKLAELLPQLEEDPPTHAALRALAAYLAWAAALPAPPAELRPQLNQLGQVLERHEDYLGVRAAWLAWSALHRLTGGDVLALAKARDRSLERLHRTGLGADLDLPSFLRFTAVQASTRFRQVRDQVARLRKSVQEWAKKGANPGPGTPAYVDLLFAYGLARLGETAEAELLLREAGAALDRTDPVHHWLHDAYEHRIRQAMEGKGEADPLPEELLHRLERIDTAEYAKELAPRRAGAAPETRYNRYMIDRLREHSRVLEPHEKVNSFRRWFAINSDELGKELAGWVDVTDRAELAARVRALLNGKRRVKDAAAQEFRILTAALDIAPRLGETLAGEILERVGPVLARVASALERALLLEKGLFVAGHFDRPNDVQAIVARFQQLLELGSKAFPLDKLETLEALIGQSFRSLRKLGLRDQAAAVLGRIAEFVASYELPRSRAAAEAGKLQRVLLEVAGGWFYFDENDRAVPALDQARALLLQKELAPFEQTRLACAYLRALGQAPAELALPRVQELFHRLEGIFDGALMKYHFSLTRLNVAEAAVLALVSEDFTLDRAARRWLDEDEYVVRRRIHRDVRTALAQAGL